MNPIVDLYHRNLELEYQDRPSEQGENCPCIFCEPDDEVEEALFEPSEWTTTELVKLVEYDWSWTTAEYVRECVRLAKLELERRGKDEKGY